MSFDFRLKRSYQNLEESSRRTEITTKLDSLTKKWFTKQDREILPWEMSPNKLLRDVCSPSEFKNLEEKWKGKIEELYDDRGTLGIDYNLGEKKYQKIENKVFKEKKEQGELAKQEVRITHLMKRFNAVNPYIQKHWGSIPYLGDIKKAQCPVELTRGETVAQVLRARESFLMGVKYARDRSESSHARREWELKASQSISKLESIGLKIAFYGRSSDKSLDVINLKDLYNRYQEATKFLNNRDNWKGIPGEIHGETENQLRKGYDAVYFEAFNSTKDVPLTKDEVALNDYLGLLFFESLKKDIEDSKLHSAE